MGVLRLRARQQDRPGTVTFLLKGFLGDTVPVASGDPEHYFLRREPCQILVSPMAPKWALARAKARSEGGMDQLSHARGAEYCGRDSASM
jgi:hypothetical protein